jgi:hypothetical protein
MKFEKHIFPMSDYFNYLSRSFFGNPHFFEGDSSLRPASQLSGITPSTLRRMADSGLIACRKTPQGHRRFLKSALEEYVLKEGSHRSLSKVASV